MIVQRNVGRRAQCLIKNCRFRWTCRRRQLVIHVDQFLTNPQDLGPTALRPELYNRIVSKENRPHPIAAMQRSPGCESRYLCGSSGFGCAGTTKKHGGSLINNQQDRAFPFFGIDSHVGFAKPAVALQSIVRMSSPGR